MILTNAKQCSKLWYVLSLLHPHAISLHTDNGESLRPDRNQWVDIASKREVALEYKYCRERNEVTD